MGSLYNGFGGSGDWNNLETPSAPGSITRSILKEARSFHETNGLPLIEFFKLLKIAASISGGKLQPLFHPPSSSRSSSEPPHPDPSPSQEICTNKDTVNQTQNRDVLCGQENTDCFPLTPRGCDRHPRFPRRIRAFLFSS